MFAKALWDHSLLSWALILAMWGCCLWLWFWPTLPGVAIAILGTGAAILAFREMRHAHKLLATIAIFALMGIEIRDIRKDRLESDKSAAAQRQKDNDTFNAISDGIKTAITQSQNQFAATKQGVDKVLSKTKEAADTAAEAVNTMTGGKGFAYFTLSTATIQGRLSEHLMVNLTVKGTRILRQLQAHVVDYKAFQSDLSPIDPSTIMSRDATNTVFGDVKAGDGPVFSPVGIMTDNKLQIDYLVSFFALNGTWLEEMHYIHAGESLPHAIRVVWQDFPADGNVQKRKETIVHQDISKDYPRINGEVQWVEKVFRQ